MIEINNKKLCESCFSEIDAAETCPCCGYNRSEFSPDPMVLPLGTKLNDKIVIGRVMGKGGFGITYLGYDLRVDKIIAVKEYYPNGISYRVPGGTEVAVADTKSADTFESGAEKFYTEAEMVSQFNGNPNIVSVYDYFRANSTVYLIMEYLRGITLKNYVKKHGKLTDGQALYVMDKIVAALSITHSAGVLHRDISPDNIMICGDGKIKLIDFGAARQILTESSSNLTVVMKPGYTPIEQYTKKGKQGAWTDIYSLGVSMYYALTKAIIDDPYSRMDSDEEFDENKHKINESLWVILKKCTMINASDRYGSAIDLRKALKSVSEPLKAEMIQLSAEDLKDEPEEKEDAAAYITAAPLDDDIPLTVMSDDPDSAEEIEIFESSTPDELVPDGISPDEVTHDEIADDVSDVTAVNDTDISAPVTAERAKPSKKKGKLIAAICSAAALVIVVVCVVVGINNRHEEPDITSDPNSSVSGDPSSVSSSSNVPNDDVISDSGTYNRHYYDESYPEMKDGMLFFEMDSSYPESGMSRQISKDNFLRFDGDVKVTLELEHIPSSEVWVGDSVRIKDDGKFVEVMAFNNGISEDESDDYYRIFSEQTEFSFVVSRRNVENLSGGMAFGVFNMFVRSAVLQAYDPAELEPGKDAVIVNIDSHSNDSLSNFISLDTLKSFNSDVKVTLDIEYEKMETDADKLDAYICACNSDRQELAIEVGNNSPMPWWEDREHVYDLGARSVTDKFIFTLPKSEIKKLDENGLCFHSNNLHIKTAAVESASITVELDLVYPGAYNYSNEIPKSVLDKFDGDVKITLDLDKYNDVQDDNGLYYGLIEPVDITKSVTVNAFNMTVAGGMIIERAKMYQLGYDAEKFVFVITKESIDSLYSGKLRFKVVNLTVNSATLEKYYPEELEPGSDAKIIELDDSYPGDWGGSEMIPKSTLEAFGGDVKVTLYIKESAPSRFPEDYGEWWLDELWFCPLSVNENWGWDAISVIGDNLNSYDPNTRAFYLGMREQAAPVPEVITFVLPQFEIAKMGEGMLFQTSCLYVKSAALEKA